MTLGSNTRVPLRAVLARYGTLENLRRRGNRLIGACPIHDGSNKRQFVVNDQDSTWFCFGDCKRGGGVLAFISAIERVTEPAAARLIADWFAPQPSSPTKPRRSMMGTRPTHKVLAVSERPDANGAVKSFYTKIGVAWPIRNGAGLSIQLDALPINNRLIVTEISDEDERASSLPTAPESTS